MTMGPIRSVAAPASLDVKTVDPAGPKSEGLDFANALKDAIGNAGTAERTADDAAQRFAAGDPNVGIHEVMIASEKAAISVKYAVNLKNRLIDAYKELLNTPL
jgi:flagellar hook-basal body complex protein FliE